MVLFVFIFGLIIGSFVNVLIYRIPRGESIVVPGSYCTSCSHSLKWYDNIPILSYVMLKGKCRYCREKISLQYPIVEALNGILYILLYYTHGPTLEFLFLALISSMLIAIAGTDITAQVVPDGLVIAVFVLSSIEKLIQHYIFHESVDIKGSILGALFGGALFTVISLISKGGMGGGDITLISSLGFVLGLEKEILAVFLSFIIGAVSSLFLVGTKAKSMKDYIPFGPFIILSFFITIFFGDRILAWYLGLLAVERGFGICALW